MADNTTIILDWDGLREQANQINDKILPLVESWEKTLNGDATELGGYSSEFTSQAMTTLQEIAQQGIGATTKDMLTHYMESLYATADTHEDNETKTTQELSGSGGGGGVRW